MKKNLALLLALMMCISLLAGGFAVAADIVVIDLYSFNDFHGTVDKSASGSNPGADRFVALVQELMKDNPNSAVFSAGDTYQGSPLSNLFFGEPVSEMLKYLGVKYSALGNHEFDWGVDKIDKFIEDGEITFLAANVFYEETGEIPDFCEPYAIIEFDGVKVGIIGLATTETPSLVKAENVEGLVFSDPVAIVGEWEPFLRNELECDIVIALTHMPADKSAGEFTCSDLAETDEGSKLDGMFGGHSHQHKDLEVNGVKIMSAGYNGRGLAVMSFEFDKTAGELVGVTTKLYVQNDMNQDTILPSNPLVVNVEIKDMIAAFDEAAGPLFRQWVGYYGEPILSQEDQAAWATRIVWDYIVGETGENYVLFQNSGGWRNTSPYDRKATDVVTMRYLYTVMPFDNEIVLMDMKGSDLLADLLSDEAEVTGYKCIEGAYEKDGKWFLSTGAEIKNDDTLYKVACNDFMFVVNAATGLGGDYYNFTKAIDAFYMGVPLRSAMIEVLLARAGFTAPLDPPYDLDPVNPNTKWYYDAAVYMIENGILPLTGTYWGTSDKVDVATAIEAMYNLEGRPKVEGENFADVKETDWFYDSALWAKSIELAEGDDYGEYRGTRNITRAEQAAVFVNYLEIVGYELETADISGFADVGAIPGWAAEKEVLDKMVGSGIMGGRDDNTLAPNDTAMKYELARLIMNVIEFMSAQDTSYSQAA